MRYPSPLVEGVLLGRRLRFFADVRLDDGSVVVAMCANTGSLRGVLAPGQRVRLSRAANPDRRLAWDWEQARVGRTWVGVNTSIPNRAVEEASLITGTADLLLKVRFDDLDQLTDFVVKDMRGKDTFVSGSQTLIVLRSL